MRLFSDSSLRLALIMFIALIIFLALGTYSEIWISQTSKELAQEIDRLEELVKDKKWEEAHILILHIEKKWIEIEERWDIIVDHREMDEIDLTLTRSVKYIEAKNTDLTLGEISALKHLLLHIPRKESFRLRNIF
ncbi:MAG: DUF4363 family protein [Bacillota bacterium]